MFSLKTGWYTKNVSKIIDKFVRYSTLQFEPNVPQFPCQPEHVVSPATLLHLLAKNDVEFVFGSSFHQGLLPITDLYYMCKYVECKSATDAGFFAGGFARSTGRPGVVLVSGMDGVLGMMTPLFDASSDGIPLLMISVAEHMGGRTSLSQPQPTEITKHLTKESVSLSDISTQCDLIEHAFERIIRGRPGPVHIHFNYENIAFLKSLHVQDQFSKKRHLAGEPGEKSYFPWGENTGDEIIREKHFDKTNLIDNAKQSSKNTSYIYRNGSLFEDTPAFAFQKIAEVINNAEKPVIIAGHGCQSSAEGLLHFAERANIPVCTTLLGIGTFNTGHPLSLNWCGVFGFPSTNTLLGEATLIIALGSRFDERCIGKAGLFGKKAREAHIKGDGGFIHCDIRKSELDRILNSLYFINSDCEDFFSNMNKLVKYNERKEWFSRMEEVKKQQDNHSWLGVETSKESLTERNVLSCLDKHLATKHHDTIITSGVGMHQMVAAQELNFRNPRSFLTSGSAAAMGACLGYAVGTKYGVWSKNVVCVIGDGDFNMSLSTFETIAEYNIPIKILLLNNKSLLMIEIAQNLMFDGRYSGVENPPCDYKTLSDAIGMNSIHCDNVLELDEKMASFLSAKGPVLFHVDLGKNERVGYVPFNRGLDEMMIFKKNDDST